MKDKRCPKCGETKKLLDFHRDRSRKNGRCSWCKSCTIARERKNYAENREEETARKRKHYVENRKEEAARNYKYYVGNRTEVIARVRRWKKENPEKVTAQKREYRKSHKEEIAAYDREYRAMHVEELVVQRREWRKANPEKIKERNRRRRALKLGAGGSFTSAEFESIVALYAPIARPNGCLWPDDGTECRGVITPDHVIPLSKGGSNDISNIQPLCMRHNNVKGVGIGDYRQ